MKKVYIETSVIGYRTARPAKDSAKLNRQEITKTFWEGVNVNFAAYLSDVVVREIGDGDAEAARKRLDLVRGIEVLTVTPAVERLARSYLNQSAVSPKANLDAMHLAVASIYGLDYLVTWNCKHIANGDVIRRLAALNAGMDLPTPEIFTPEEFMKGFKP